MLLKAHSAVAPMYKTGLTIEPKWVHPDDRPKKCPECWRMTVINEVCTRCGCSVPLAGKALCM